MARTVWDIYVLQYPTIKDAENQTEYSTRSIGEYVYMYINTPLLKLKPKKKWKEECALPITRHCYKDLLARLRR